MPQFKDMPQMPVDRYHRVPGEARVYGAGNNIVVSGSILFKFVLVMRYVCGSCGFSEEWIDTAEDIAKVRKKYGS